METLKEFFEVSSIHGLYQISKSKSIKRIFWSVVSTSGFILAFSQIYENFQNFSKTPISTIVETWPIEKVTFPSIIVCPVKDTFTNLNYDLVNAGSYNLNKEERNHLIQLFYESFQEVDYKITMDYMKEMRQNDLLRTYYEKLTQIEIPSKSELLGNLMFVRIHTYATSGQIQTPYFEKKIFNPNHFKLDFSFDLEIVVPKSIRKSNATIEIRIYHDIEVGQEYITVNNKEIAVENKSFAKMLNVKDCIYFKQCRVLFKRSMSEVSFRKWKNKRFTGMQVTWNFNANIKPEETVELSALNNIFCKTVNILQETENKGALMADVKKKRSQISDNIFSSNSMIMFELENIFDTLFPSYENVSSKPINSKLINEHDLEMAEDMLVYLFNDPQPIWKHWKLLYENLFESGSERMILTTLSGILAADYDIYSKTVAKILLDRVTSKLSLKYNSIKQMSNNSDFEYTNTITNHPVHILDKSGNLSPSALIPFCQFGNDEISSMGSLVEEFSIPVCKIFKKTILLDKMCYKADINEHIFKSSSEDLKTGFTFLVDNNFDRQIITSTGNSEVLEHNLDLSKVCC